MKDAAYWVKKFKHKEISLPEYYTELDKKVQEQNPEINGLVEWNFEELLETAKRFSLLEDLPFSGMPLPLKMMRQDKAGWKATIGSRLFSNVRATETLNFNKSSYKT